MDMPTAMESTSREELLNAMAEVMERQARVARAEAALAAAHRRLGDSVARLSRVARNRGEGVELPPLAAAALQLEGLASPGSADEEPAGTLRERIVAVMNASPDDVYTPARLAPLVGSPNRDSIRNTLLVLAAMGLIEKRGAGQYRARKEDPATRAEPEAGPEGGAPRTPAAP
jgi:hypothetical protein